MIISPLYFILISRKLKIPSKHFKISSVLIKPFSKNTVVLFILRVKWLMSWNHLLCPLRCIFNSLLYKCQVLCGESQTLPRFHFRTVDMCLIWFSWNFDLDGSHDFPETLDLDGSHGFIETLDLDGSHVFRSAISFLVLK